MSAVEKKPNEEPLIPFVPFLIIYFKETWHWWLAFSLTLFVWLNPIYSILPNWLLTGFITFQVLTLIENLLYILGSVEFTQDGNKITYMREIRYIKKPKSKLVLILYFLTCKPLGVFCTYLILSLLAIAALKLFANTKNISVANDSVFAIILYTSWVVSMWFAGIRDKVIRKVAFREEAFTEIEKKGDVK